MNIVVPIRLVPDLVEEIGVDATGTDLDRRWLRLIINEFDDHAIEQALLLKERSGGQVTVIAPDAEGVDEVLFTAAAKGADALVKLVGAPERLLSHAYARALAGVIGPLAPDSVLTGVQANDDLDGAVGPLLAEYLGLPYVGYVAGVSLEQEKAVVRKEFPGGLVAELEVQLPAVLGIQAAEQPPRYVAVSRVRQAMKSSTIEEQSVDFAANGHEFEIDRMYPPEPSERAVMIEGDEGTVADRLVEILRDAGMLR